MEKLDVFVEKLLSLADAADAVGMTKEADKISAILPAIGSLKTAQYEGVQNYWIANGRAFEKAWKEKRKKGDDPANFRSANDCWWEVLEEYQKSLLGDQKDFVAKYASVAGRNEISEKAAAKLLVAKLGKKLATGQAPGVSLYESIKEMSEGEHVNVVQKATEEVLKDIVTAAKEKGLEKIATDADSLLKEAGFWGDLAGGAKNWAAARGLGLTEIQGFSTNIKEQAKKLYDVQRGIQSGTLQINPMQIQQYLLPLLNYIYKYNNLAKQAGMTTFPPIPDIRTVQFDKGANSPELKQSWQKFYDGINAFVQVATDRDSVRELAKIIHDQQGKQNTGYAYPQDQSDAQSKQTEQAKPQVQQTPITLTSPQRQEIVKKIKGLRITDPGQIVGIALEEALNFLNTGPASVVPLPTTAVGEGL